MGTSTPYTPRTYTRTPRIAGALGPGPAAPTLQPIDYAGAQRTNLFSAPKPPPLNDLNPAARTNLFSAPNTTTPLANAAASSADDAAAGLGRFARLKQFARNPIVSALGPDVAAARAAEGGYLGALKGTTPLAKEALQGGKFLKFIGPEAGSALASKAGLKGSLALAGFKGGAASLAALPVGQALEWGGRSVMGSDGADEKGADWYDAGQFLEGAGEALPWAAGAGVAAAALASNPIGWGVLAAGALGYGIYSMFSNDDDASVIKEQSAAGAKEIDEYLTMQGSNDPDLNAKFATLYTEQLRELEDPDDEEARAELMESLKTGMDAAVAHQQEMQMMQWSREFDRQTLLSQQAFAAKVMAPYAQQVQTGNQMVDAAYAGIAGQGGQAGQLAAAARAHYRSQNDQLAGAMMQEALAAPQAAQDQASYIAQLEQQLQAMQMAAAAAE